MSTILFQGDAEKGGIPRKASVRVESLPKRSVVFSGTVSKSVALDLDPGKYIYSVVKIIGPKRTLNYTGEFLHEITEEAWKKLTECAPQMCKAIHTSDGPRWRCTFGKCRDEEFTSEVSALLHEVGHFGVSEAAFLKNPDMQILYNGQAAVEEYIEAQRGADRAAGRIPIDPLQLGAPAAAGPVGRE